MHTKQLTMAQALIEFLKNQYVERDGQQHKFFAGCFGIFGHGNVAGIGQALQENPDFRYYLSRNEQGMVHTAAAFAKMSNRLRAFACTTSVGPGATNMVTAAAGATINRLPVLLLAGDVFARRNVAPVLQQLELPSSPDISVNDCFKPISRYWDRINRPEQIITALPEAMRILTSQAETGTVTLSLPQDVQVETFDYPAALFDKRVWIVPRPKPDAEILRQAVDWIRTSQAPLIIAGGGIIYSEATDILTQFVERVGIPVVETQAGKGALNYDHLQSLGAIGVTGTPGANTIAREADLIIGIGTRYSDFTTASKTAFQNPDVRFININISDSDAYKHAALPIIADARATLEELNKALDSFKVNENYRKRNESFNKEWDTEVSRIYNLSHGPPISQGEVIGAVNDATNPQDVIVGAAGSLPGDLHKLWRTRDPKGYNMEYGYSCMGYEIAGGLGVKMADPDREVYVMIGDGSYLMMAQEIVTSLQENFKLNIILVNNHGFSSIGGLSESIGSAGFGTRYLYRNEKTGNLDGERLPIDFSANASSLGAHTINASDLPSLKAALDETKKQTKTTVIVIETDREQRVPGYESWWDVPIAKVSTQETVLEASKKYEINRKKERYHL
ncbi:MAG: 3D-(3,5/4)-trihydroxycyclohexane-1,2-dione acylhydrolase (decyclizing) [Anaerolineae bacterium]|nr:3D-(3,5/4)-trihydroxycyclohexane-1,2-dione acylhydrolase (decyclizing) [Anaerolineae bacterium]MDK1082106.1 3D-(3,5/4)-trihydroxycyclohexane-1,2-dione acylhydrolase (decyclizing) [Anaerolineae bacterium]